MFEIDRVLDFRRAASLKAGGIGMRYLLGIDDDPSIKLYGLTDEGKVVMDGFVKIFIDQK